VVVGVLCIGAGHGIFPDLGETLEKWKKEVNEGS
jgi:hypothetical protein